VTCQSGNRALELRSRSAESPPRPVAYPPPTRRNPGGVAQVSRGGHDDLPSVTGDLALRRSHRSRIIELAELCSLVGCRRPAPGSKRAQARGRLDRRSAVRALVTVITDASRNVGPGLAGRAAHVRHSSAASYPVQPLGNGLGRGGEGQVNVEPLDRRGGALASCTGSTLSPERADLGARTPS
jgi:hypothetical protein